MPSGPSKAHQQLAKKITDDYLWGKRYRDQFSPDWERWYKLYRNKMITEGTGESYPFESQIFVPYVFSIIETQIPILMNQLFGASKFVEAKGRKIESEVQAPMVGDIVNYQFERDLHFFQLAYTIAKQALIYGTSPAFVDWTYQTRKVRARVPEQNLNGTFIGEKTVTLNRVRKNNPISKAIDVFRYFQCPVTPGNPWEDDGVLFAGWEFALTKEEIFQKKRDGIFNDNVEQIRSSSGTDRAFKNIEDRLRVIGKAGPTDPQREPTGRPLFPCIMYFGLVPTPAHEFEYHQSVVCYPNGFPEGEGGGGDGFVIMDERDPFHHDKIPINLTRVNYNEGELYGMSDVEVIESLQIELTDQRNQRNDNIVRLMDPMWKRKRSAEIDDTQLFFRPNGMVDVDNMDDLEPLIPNPNQLQNAFLEESVLKQDMQFATGITDFIVGTFQNSSGFNDTATGISLIQAAAQNRIILKAQFLQTTVKNLAEMVWALDAQFLPFNTIMQVLNPDEASRYRFIRVTPEIIQGEYDFSIVSAPAGGNPQVRQQQLIQVTQALPPLMELAAQTGQPLQVNWAVLIRRLLEEFQIPNVAAILPQIADQELVNGLPEAFNEEVGGPTAQDPAAENAAILEGARNVPVNPGDDDQLHVIEHQKAQEFAEGDALSELQAHMSRHVEQLRGKKEQLRQNLQGFTALLGQGGLAQPGTPEVNAQTGNSSPNDAGGVETLIRALGNGNAGNA